MCGLDLSTREGDGHVAAVLCGEPGIAGVAAPLAAAAAREPQLIVNLAGLRIPGSSGAAALARGRKQAPSWSWPARSWRCPGWPGTRPAAAGTATEHLAGRADDEYPALPARVTSTARDLAGKRKEHGMDWMQTWGRAWSYGSFATS
jgi:hypothetical protein